MKDRVHLFYVVTLFPGRLHWPCRPARRRLPRLTPARRWRMRAKRWKAGPLPDDAAEEQVIRYVTRDLSRLNPAL